MAKTTDETLIGVTNETGIVKNFNNLNQIGKEHILIEALGKY